MQFRVLGPVELAADGRRVVLSSERQRAVLAALLAHPGETLSADRLVAVVWGDRPPASAHQSLHSHISRLRRVLATAAGGDPGTIVTDARGYRLVLGAHDVDATRFEMLLTQAHSQRDRDPGQAVALLDEALGLWRGPAFGDLAARDIDMVRSEATRLEQLRAAAIADRIDAMLALGGHAQVIGQLEATVADDPLAERPHGQLMLALYRSGRQADALATYRTFRRRLREETGLDPSPGLQQLHERMLRQDPDLAVTDQSRDAPAGALPGAGSGAMTPSATGGAARYGDLVGRDDDTAAIESLLGAARVVTLTGPAGVGKTRLASEVAGRVGDRFPDGVGVCSLAAVPDPASLPAAIVGALGIQHKGERSAEQILLAALGTRRFLLVLDNCEHLREPVAALVDQVRRRCARVVVLSTSREYLHLPDERVWEVAPLPVPPAGASPAEVAEAPAGALFCARARALSQRFTLTGENAPAVAEICRRLDGIPLAIELAAARIRAFAPSDLAERLEHRFRLLTAGPTGPTGAAGRHRTLQQAVDWSYELLSETEARLFDRLSVFASSFSLAAAERVCVDDHLAGPDIAGVLAELVDKSMVATAPAGGQVRYQLLDTMRLYGARRLELSSAAQRYQRAHAVYYVDLAEALAPAVRGADERTALATIDAEFDNLRLAHAWLVDAGEADPALRLTAALHDYAHYRLRDEIITWTRRALELPGARERPAFAAALATAARGALHRGEIDRARGNANTALAHAEPDSLPVLWALHVLTEAALYQGRLTEALALADQRADLATRTGQHYYRAIAGVSRVLANLYDGSQADALTYVDDARQAAEACGNLTALAWVRYAHGEALMDLEPRRAAELLEQAIDTATQIDSQLARGVALVSLASLLGRRGDTRRALQLFRDAVSHWRGIGDHTHQVTTLRNLVELLAHVGADEAAAVLHGAVVTGATPSFGAEADRVDTAWRRVVDRLGAERADGAAERGRRMTPAHLVDETLAHLHALLEETAEPAGRPGR
jgi:predicted ATPase/DNA-binding SARP family transcriptional activator